MSKANQRWRANQKRQLYKLYGGHCFYCLCEIERASENDTRDHIIPKVRGGANSLNNYVLACKPCNNERGSKQAVRYLLRWCASLSINQALAILSTPEDRLRFHGERLRREAGR